MGSHLVDALDRSFARGRAF